MVILLCPWNDFSESPSLRNVFQEFSRKLTLCFRVSLQDREFIFAEMEGVADGRGFVLRGALKVPRGRYQGLEPLNLRVV